MFNFKVQHCCRSNYSKLRQESSNLTLSLNLYTTPARLSNMFESKRSKLEDQD